jgi:hypothetical protein
MAKHDQQHPEVKPQPWHAADEKPGTDRKGGAPIGTHSLTGGGATVGIPTPGPEAADKPERSRPRDAAEPERVDPLLEPRAQYGGLLGPKP